MNYTFVHIPLFENYENIFDAEKQQISKYLDNQDQPTSNFLFKSKGTFFCLSVFMYRTCNGGVTPI